MSGITTPRLSAGAVDLAERETGNYFVAVYPPFSAWAARRNADLLNALESRRTGPIGLYVHLPFCPKKCDYCYYLSYTGKPASVVDRYIDSLIHEAQCYASLPGIEGRRFRFVYFGGGTPSSLSCRQLGRLLGGLKETLFRDRIAEITYECAPRSVRDDFLAALKEAGVTRLSMGVQSLNDALLKANGRVHLVADVYRAIARIRQTGFNTVNLDLMCGLSGETEDQWGDTVRKAIELSPDSITIYQTEIPHNTRIYEDLKNQRLHAPPPSWDTKRKRLAYGFGMLEQAGYGIVSAYNAVRDPERHAFLYQDMLWRGSDMAGLGVAAFGYFNGVHYQNKITLDSYTEAVDKGALPLRRAFVLSNRDRFIRAFILQLKTGSVEIGPLCKRFSLEPADILRPQLESLAAAGYLSFSQRQIRLTRSGLLKVDRLIPVFYDPEYRDVRYT